ncbi:hypothetical protein [Candidatus Trichorickettsia mobilis]|uniref:hypothetical protein n=1 Tax=Candidatus Trichorickettsia mobilis TaxID=1346319 RepID=UPI00292D8A29|nr:hypothetical protein [Candidatus Trichorickettsia mobilis]
MKYPAILQIPLDDYVNGSGLRNVFSDCLEGLRRESLEALFSDIGYLSVLSTGKQGEEVGHEKDIITDDDNIISQQISKSLQNIKYNVSLAKEYKAPECLYKYLISEIIGRAKALLDNKSLSVADTVLLINIISITELTDLYKDLLKETLLIVFTSNDTKSISSDSWSHIFEFISNYLPEEQQQKVLFVLAKEIVNNNAQEDFKYKCKDFEYQYGYLIGSVKLMGISDIKLTESLEDINPET